MTGLGQNRVSAKQCHMAVLQVSVVQLTSYSIQLIAGTENFRKKFSKVPTRALLLNWLNLYINLHINN